MLVKTCFKIQRIVIKSILGQKSQLGNNFLFFYYLLKEYTFFTQQKKKIHGQKQLSRNSENTPSGHYYKQISTF
jgi:hypothetical protein